MITYHVEKMCRIVKQVHKSRKSGIINLSEEQTNTRKAEKMLNISFNTDNSAFWEETEGEEYFNFDEVKNILGYIVLSMKEGDSSGKLKDSNGNTIGEWQWI